MRIKSCATGRAADRMSKICRREAKTLHRMLETSPDESGEMVFKRNARNPLPYDVVIADEASMMDLNMSASLLEALKPPALISQKYDPTDPEAPEKYRHKPETEPAPDATPYPGVTPAPTPSWTVHPTLKAWGYC